MYAAINEGIRVTNTEWCTYVNGDDLLYPKAMQALYERISAPDDIIYGNSDFIDNMGRFISSWNSPPPEEIYKIASLGVNPIQQLGTVFRRKVFDDLGGFDAEFQFLGDFDFFLRAMLKRRKFRVESRLVLGAFRVHHGQLSQNHSACKREAAESLRRNDVKPESKLFFNSLLRFRGRNWANYFVRILRGYQLTGRFRFQRTLSIVQTDSL